MDIDKTCLSFTENVDKITPDLGPERKRDQKCILVLINPHSGRGRSMKIFKKIVEPQLKTNGVNYSVFMTDANLRVKDKLTSMTGGELDSLRSVLIISGDGLVFEVVNAFMNREDWRERIKLPLSVIPTGSGNGLAYTLIRLRHPQLTNRKEAIKLCCKQAIQDTQTYTDLIKVSFGRSSKSPKAYFSFLSIGWGLLADIDIDSEWLRPLGDFRFTIYGLLRSITSVSYRGNLSYKLASNDEQDQSNITMSDDWIHIEDTFACLYGVYLSHIATKTKFSPKSTMTDGIIYLTIIRGKMNPKKVIEFLLSIQDGSHERLSYVQIIPVKTFKFQPFESSKIVIDGEVVPWTIEDGPITVEIIPEKLTLKWNPDE